MTHDTVTLALEGEVSLADFASAMQRLDTLVSALTAEIAGEISVDWSIDELQAGSAVATVRGESEQLEAVERIVRAYANVGVALEKRESIPYGERVRKSALSLVSVLDSRIISVRFETAFGDATVGSQPSGAQQVSGLTHSYGTVRGQVQTLSRRRGLKFVLYDLIFDRAISCYLQEGQEDRMRNAWGKKVVVSGRIGREPENGRPVVVRDITHIRILEDADPGSYRLARGVLHRGHDAEPPENIIRRQRDA